jgi:hypothetical protein
MEDIKKNLKQNESNFYEIINKKDLKEKVLKLNKKNVDNNNYDELI